MHQVIRFGRTCFRTGWCRSTMKGCLHLFVKETADVLSLLRSEEPQSFQRSCGGHGLQVLVARVEKAISATPGVVSVSVDIAAKHANVVFAGVRSRRSSPRLAKLAMNAWLRTRPNNAIRFYLIMFLVPIVRMILPRKTAFHIRRDRALKENTNVFSSCTFRASRDSASGSTA